MRGDCKGGGEGGVVARVGGDVGRVASRHRPQTHNTESHGWGRRRGDSKGGVEGGVIARVG